MGVTLTLFRKWSSSTRWNAINMGKELDTGYEAKIKEFRVAFSCSCAYVGIALILLGVGLDFGLYPYMQLPFALARAVVSILIFCIIVLLKSGWGERRAHWLTFIWLLLPQIMITWMIGMTEGAASLYSVGLHLAIYASGIALPFSLLQTLALGGCSFLLYVAACLAHPGGFELRGPLLVNSLFLIFAICVSTVCAFFNERYRLMLFRLRTEVAKKNTELESANRILSDIMLQKEKMAAIGTLAAGLLHEVNNPLNFCLMAIDIAAEEPAAKSNPGLSDCLADARKGMRRVQHIVSDLKTFAYRKADDAKDTPFLFAKALESAARLTGHELKGVRLTQDLPVDTLVCGDEASIIGVLINLFSNAVLAMRDAHCPTPEILVSAAWKCDRLQVAVRDNGPGIAPENLMRVFEPFFTTRDVGQGLGLGLSISYGVIERQGGTLVAESVPGEWTQMLFDLPRGA
jgi:two-component system, sensor histidine kinase PhcS